MKKLLLFAAAVAAAALMGWPGSGTSGACCRQRSWCSANRTVC